MTITVPQTPVFMKVPSACFLKLPADESGIGIWLNLAAVRRIVSHGRNGVLIVEHDDGSKQHLDGQQAEALSDAIDQLSATIDKSNSEL